MRPGQHLGTSLITDNAARFGLIRPVWHHPKPLPSPAPPLLCGMTDALAELPQGGLEVAGIRHRADSTSVSVPRSHTSTSHILAIAELVSPVRVDCCENQITSVIRRWRAGP
jgi:hypothetical protein